MSPRGTRRSSGRWRLAALVFVATTGLGCRRVHGGSADGSPPDASADGGATADASADASPVDDAIPATSSDELTVRAKHLLEAIAEDNADLASDLLFPRDAWIAMRAAVDPGKEWEKRVSRPFRRAVHALSRHHKELNRAAFASLELGHSMSQAPTKKHGWQKSLWIVTGSHITFMVDGHTRTLPVRELTAWRGAWYVTRL